MAAVVIRELTPGPGVAPAVDRSARTPTLLGFEGDPGRVLRASTLVVVGAGSVGLRLADLAARVGVARLLIVDPGHTKPESLLTHPLQPWEVGRPKAILAGERARAVSPATRVFVFDGAFQELPADALVGATFVLLASDNLACEVAVAARCLELGLPLVQASVYGPALVAQVRCLAHAGPAGPCLACSFTPGEWEDLDRGTLFSCLDGGRRRAPEHGRGSPTMSLPQLCALAADLAFCELTRLALALGPAAGNRLIEYCGYEPRLTRTVLGRCGDCPLPHATRLRHVRPERPLASLPLGEVLAAVGPIAARPDASLVGLSLRVEGHAYAREARCGCRDRGGAGAPGHFVPESGAGVACARCRRPVRSNPFTTDREVAGPHLAPHLARTLGELGLASPCPPVWVRDEADAVLLSDAPPLRVYPDSKEGVS